MRGTGAEGPDRYSDETAESLGQTERDDFAVVAKGIAQGARVDTRNAAMLALARIVNERDALRKLHQNAVALKWEVERERDALNETLTTIRSAYAPSPGWLKEIIDTTFRSLGREES